MSEFYKYFKENMDGLNLQTPENLFGSNQTAISTATAILALIDKFGRRVTILDLIGAGTKLEKLAVVGSVNAAYYAGAVIGSIAIASGRTLAGGTSLSDILLHAHMNHINRSWLPAALLRWPGIYRSSKEIRKIYKHT